MGLPALEPRSLLSRNIFIALFPKISPEAKILAALPDRMTVNKEYVDFAEQKFTDTFEASLAVGTTENNMVCITKTDNPALFEQIVTYTAKALLDEAKRQRLGVSVDEVYDDFCASIERNKERVKNNQPRYIVDEGSSEISAWKDYFNTTDRIEKMGMPFNGFHSLIYCVCDDIRQKMGGPFPHHLQN